MWAIGMEPIRNIIGVESQVHGEEQGAREEKRGEADQHLGGKDDRNIREETNIVVKTEYFVDFV